MENSSSFRIEVKWIIKDINGTIIKSYLKFNEPLNLIQKNRMAYLTNTPNANSVEVIIRGIPN